MHASEDTAKSKQVTVHLPALGWIALPAMAGASLPLVMAANIISLLKSGDWSALSLKLHMLTSLVIVSLIGLFLLIVYCLLRILSPFLIIDSDGIAIVRSGRAKEYMLEEIESFLVVTTASLAVSGAVLKTELFAINAKIERKLIYVSPRANRLQPAWKKTAEKIRSITGKNLSMQFLVEDIDGRVYDLKTYQEKLSAQDKRAPFPKD